MSELKKVPLHDRMVAAGGRMVEFAGYSMPVQFAGIKEEHHAVRNGAGLFDVSHMGEVFFKGPGAIDAVDRLMTNDPKKLQNSQAMYTAMCNESGGIIDDLVVYRLADDEVMVCVNASRREADFAHMKQMQSSEVEVSDRSDEFAQLALQGPESESLLAGLVDFELGELGFFHIRNAKIGPVSVMISRTGYTGEDGFEIYIPREQAGQIWDALIEKGASPCGLGCRDTLRLEARMLLYGQDISESTNPIEAGLAWVTKLERDTDFIGKPALLRVQEEGPRRRLRGFVLQDRGVIRPGYLVYEHAEGGDPMGEITSGTFSPTLEQSIGLGYVDAACADLSELFIDIRGRRSRALVTRKPFYKRSK